MNSSEAQDEIVIAASARIIFAVLQDSQLLPQWMPVVNASDGLREVCGAQRECDVTIAGRRGRLKEVCTECLHNRHIAWRLTEDTFGFNKLLEEFGFAFDLLIQGPQQTLVVHETVYRPKNLLGRLLVALIMKRKFREVRRAALANLKALAERLQAQAEPHAQPAVNF
jgi:polyketide cyclase/dehydrase/lipid transport protein